MSIERCGLSFEERTYSNAGYVFFERNWNGRKISLETGNMVHLIKGCSSQGFIEIKHKILPMKGSVGGSIEGKASSEGNSSIEGEVHVSTKDEDGNTISVTAEGNVKNDRDGHITADGGLKVSFEREF